MDTMTKETLDKLREARECSREANSLNLRLKKLKERERVLQGEIDHLLLAINIIATNNPRFATEVQQVMDLDQTYRQELAKSQREGIYPEPETQESAKPTSLANIIQEITASMEGEFKAGDIRKLLLERDPELHGQSHAASITTALARLTKEGGTLERVSGGGRGKEAIFRRKT